MVALTIFALLVLPTMLMGATLPILVSHLHRHYRNLGKSVGLLYSINTVGSAIACFATADVLFVVMGEQASVWAAAICNFAVGILVMRYARRIAAQANAGEEPVVASEGV
jgi:predicted membrane-bound spermidine synthase